MKASARRLFVASAVAATALSATLVATGVLFLHRPETFVTPRTAAFLLGRLGAAYGPRWDGLEVAAEPLKGARHRYWLGLSGLCLADPAGSVSACFDRFEVVVTVAFSVRGVALERVERLVLQGRRLRWEPAKRRPGGATVPGLPAWPRSGFGMVRVELPSIVLVGPRGGVTGRLSAASDGAEGAKGSMEVAAGAGFLRSAKLSRCVFKGGEQAGVTCLFAVAPRLGADVRLNVFRALTGELRIKGGVKGRDYSLGLTAALDPLEDWYAAEGRLEAEVKGKLGEAPAFVEVSASLDAAMARFEDVVLRLRDSAYAVPAPFHVLKGPLTMKASARGDPRSGLLGGTVKLTADLAAGRQKLVGEVTAEATVKAPFSPTRSAAVEAEALIKEGAFELPRLEVARIPKGKLDARIRTGAELEGLRDAAGALPGPAGLGNLRARMTLKTAKPVALLSNLAKGPIPMSLDLAGEYPSASRSGLVSFGGFDVELFRRNAAVDHIDVRLSSGDPHGALAGLIVYKTAEFVISIHLSGTTDRPLVGFTSVPALKREEILALLIFGKRPGDLDPEALTSVGNTQRAIENRSFGLASLYLFGAMPIEHVAYDGATKNATVKLRLPGGALLQLGSDFERSRGLTLRQPLAPHWAIQSEFSDQGPESRFGTTFLEWFNRY